MSEDIQLERVVKLLKKKIELKRQWAFNFPEGHEHRKEAVHVIEGYKNSINVIDTVCRTNYSKEIK
jgi:hypothetical protein